MSSRKLEYISGLFIKEDIADSEPSSLPDVKYYSISSGIEFIKGLKEKGIKHFLLFGVPLKKDITLACTNKGIIVQFIKKARSIFGDSIVLIADVGLSPYRADRHSTVTNSEQIDEERSYIQASNLAIAFARAGANFVAPCLSLPYQVRQIRSALDSAGLIGTKIMAYSAKFSSSLYGPYRSTIKSVLRAQDKKSYQTDYSSPEKALEQISADEKQKADVVMVKPGMLYLDILFQARKLTNLPLAVYHVSGEYAMLKSAVSAGFLDENEAFDEVHSAFKRAGADFIIGYAPEHFIRWKNNMA